MGFENFMRSYSLVAVVTYKYDVEPDTNQSSRVHMRDIISVE